MSKLFLQHSGAKYPIIGGPMYPCSNPELVAAISSAGGLGIIQPVSLTYVHQYDFAQGLDYIQSLTTRPVGMNVLIEKSSRRYHQRMQSWISIALEKNIRFFITSLGKPDWVVKIVHAAGGVVYHDVTSEKWAKIAVAQGVDGLIAVNNRAGGHAGELSQQALQRTLEAFSLPLVCAGGIASREQYQQTLKSGYQAIQMGTRFIASTECKAPNAYKQAILNACEQDIVLSECLTGTPVSVILTPYIQKTGLHASPLSRWILRHKKLKYLLRLFYILRSGRALKSAILHDDKEFWQAGKSAARIEQVLSVAEIIQDLTAPEDLGITTK